MSISSDRKSPVLFLAFNRLDTTTQVLDQILAYSPSTLYIAADGHRSNKAGEAELCQEVRDLIISKTKNHDNVKLLFRDQNLGCRLAVSSAIDWFFEHEESGIILEDDCLPNQSFFTFCSEMLERYSSDERVMHVSGNNFQYLKRWSENSYYFSNFNHIWGWATWRRAWKTYDVTMADYPIYKHNQFIKSIWGKDSQLCDYWTRKFDDVYYKNYNTWDYQWTYAVWKNNGLSILPEVNLVTNIGFIGSYTHQNVFSKFLTIKTEDLGHITHPTIISKNYTADYQYSRKFYIRGFMKLKMYLLAKI